jgi:7-keto-8-aminopelargonate synthetase-like enzyme
MKKILNLINEIINNGVKKGIGHLITEDQSYDGRTITISGKQLINFGSYSYLGLETDSRLKKAGIDAMCRYGIQYPSTRAYTSCTLYRELEELIRKMFNAPVILTTSLTIGHDSVMPVIIEEGDALILDQQVHASVQRPARSLQLDGITLTIIRHNRLDELKKK